MKTRLAAVVCILQASACGYTPLYSAPPASKLGVALVSAKTGDAVASDEVLAGVRDTLAKEGALAPGATYPRVEIEVLRADESSDGIAAVDTGAGHVPLARGTEVGVIARAWIARDATSAHEADTGDMRSVDLVGSTTGVEALPAEAMRHDDALRATARRLGRRLGLRVLGHPVSRDE